MITNSDITIYNHKYNKDTRLDDWSRTVIRGVHFYIDNKAEISKEGLKSADVYKIRIPVEAECKKVFVPEDEYELQEDTSCSWTIQKDDYIVRGECDIEISRPSDLTKLKKTMCKVTSWSDNRFGNLPHWRVGGE